MDRRRRRRRRDADRRDFTQQMLLTPSVLEDARNYFNNVQTKDQQYVSLLRPQDGPAIWLNKEIMERFRPELEQYYYDPSTYDTYLEQLGIEYPTLR